MKTKWYVQLPIYAVLSVFCLIMIFPFFWMLLSSFKTEVQLFEVPPKILPHPATVKNYVDVLSDGSMIGYMANSLITALSATAICLAAGIPCAYSFARYRTPVRKLQRGTVLTLRIIPAVTFILPYFQLMKAWGLVNTRLGLILVYVPTYTILLIIMMQSFLEDFPRDIEDAGKVDGLNVIGIITRLVIPISLPIISTCSLLAFLGVWNDFLYASVIIRTPDLKTIPMGIREAVNAFQVFWGKLLSSGVIYVIPAILFTAFAQKGLVKGLTAGAVKE